MALGSSERETNRSDTDMINAVIPSQQIQKGYKVEETPMIRPYKGWSVYAVRDGYNCIALFFEKEGVTDAIGVSDEDSDLVDKARNWIDTRLENS